MSPKKQCYYHIPFKDIMASPHQNDITGIMCGWPVYMKQTLSFTPRNSEYMHDIWPLKVIHNDSIELLHYHSTKVYINDTKSNQTFSKA